MESFLNIAFKGAREAANVMLRAANQLGTIKVESKEKNDFVSEVDKESEEIIIDTILESFPSHKIIAEENGIYGNENSNYEWIIDPLDGTTNYLHGHNNYAISIALKVDGILSYGLVFAPELNELYTASKGQGATLNNKKIRVSKRVNLLESLIATGFPVVKDNYDEVFLSIIKELMHSTSGIRRKGSAALDLCDLAQGKYEGFFEFNLKPWDIAAGALIVQEAGGLITDMQGENTWLETGNIVAGNPKILSKLLRVISKYLK